MDPAIRPTGPGVSTRMRRGEHPGEAAVIVVGGGPAGASTAWSLARAGVDVLVVDRARFPRTKACAEYLSPASSRILAEMGVLAQLERSGAAQLAGMRIRATNGTTFEGSFVASHGYRALRDRGLSLPRFVLDKVLLDAARSAGARVEEGFRVTALKRDARRRVVGIVGREQDGTPRTIAAVVVVGADGLHSIVGRRLGLTRHGRLPHRYAFTAHYRDVDGIDAHGEMHVERDGYVGFADIGGGRVNVSLVVSADDAFRARGNAAAFQRLWLDSHPHLATRFAKAVRVSPVLTTGPFASRAQRTWAPGAILVGDAAEFFDPFTGEGIYTALRSGEIAAPFVLDALRAHDAGDIRAADVALRRYHRTQAREFRGKRIVERLIGLTVAHPPLIDHAAGVLRRRREMADLLIGVAGDFVPPREVLHPRFLLALLGRS